MEKNFSKAEIIKIINLYREQEAIWMVSSKNYKRVDLKKKGWESIAAEMKISIDLAKKKIKSLRSAYVAEKKKVEDRKKSGSGGDIYETNLFYFDEMTFLDEAICLRKSSSNAAPSPQKGNFYQALNNLLKSTAVQDDECLSFGKSIGMQLKKLPPLNLCQAMQEIQSVVSKHVERVLLEKSTNKNVTSLQNEIVEPNTFSFSSSTPIKNSSSNKTNKLMEAMVNADVSSENFCSGSVLY